MSHRKRDKNGKVLPKVKARARTKIRWAKRHIDIKQMAPLDQPQVKDEKIDTSGFSGMKKVDL